MATNPGRNARRDEIIVSGVQEAVLRHAMTVKKCDSCPEIIKEGEAYFRVLYFDPNKPLEMFHHECFNYEFTNREGRPRMLPDRSPDNNLQDNGIEGNNHE